MRGMGLVAALLLLVACKPVTRAPVSGLTAVTDGNLALGVVPVVKDNGSQAYRLLVCRKSESYPKWMLEDSNRCRPALLDEHNNEVVFLQDDTERDFATKYMSYGEGYTVPLLLAVGSAAAVFGVGPWLIKQPFVKSPYDAVKTFFGKVTDKIVPERFKTGFKSVSEPVGGVVSSGVGAVSRNVEKVSENVKKLNPSWIEKYRARFLFLLGELNAGRLVNKLPGVNVDFSGALREYGQVLEAAEEVNFYRGNKKLLQQLQKKKDLDAQGKFMSDLVDKTVKMNHKDNTDLLNGLDNMSMEAKMKAASSKAAGTFNKEMADLEKVANIKDPDNINLDAMTDYFSKLQKLNEIKRNNAVIAKYNESGSFDFIQKRLEITDNFIDTSVDRLTKAKEANPYNILGIKHTDFNNAAKIGATGGAAFALVTMTNLNKSVWGYADRQVNAHWSDIFYEGMADAQSVKDLSGVLTALADLFGHRVNSSALALGN